MRQGLLSQQSLPQGTLRKFAKHCNVAESRSGDSAETIIFLSSLMKTLLQYHILLFVVLFPNPVDGQIRHFIYDEIPNKSYFPIVPGQISIYLSDYAKEIYSYDTTIRRSGEMEIVEQTVHTFSLLAGNNWKSKYLLIKTKDGAYIRSDTGTTEHLLMPSSVELGSSWIGERGSNTVISLNETLKAPRASYTNCLVVRCTTKDRNDNDVVYFDYFQRGRGKIGMVRNGIVVFYMTLEFNINDRAKFLPDSQLYSQEYKFESAKQYEREEKFEKALWCYINLYPMDEKKAKEHIKSLSILNDTLDISALLDKAFLLFIDSDPEIEDLSAISRKEIIETKRKYCNNLVSVVKYSEVELSSATEYAYRSMKKQKEKDFTGALEDITKAINLDPKPKYYFSRALLERDMGKCIEAIKDYDTLVLLDNIKIGIYERYEVYTERGQCKEDINDLKGAEEDYGKAIFENNSHWMPYLLRAQLFSRQHKYKEALKDLEEVLKIEPNHVGALIEKGEIKLDIGEYKEACKAWKKALDADEHNKKKPGFFFSRKDYIEELISNNCGK